MTARQTAGMSDRGKAFIVPGLEPQAAIYHAYRSYSDDSRGASHLRPASTMVVASRWERVSVYNESPDEHTTRHDEVRTLTLD